MSLATHEHSFRNLQFDANRRSEIPTTGSKTILKCDPSYIANVEFQGNKIRSTFRGSHFCNLVSIFFRFLAAPRGTPGGLGQPLVHAHPRLLHLFDCGSRIAEIRLERAIARYPLFSAIVRVPCCRFTAERARYFLFMQNLPSTYREFTSLLGNCLGRVVYPARPALRDDLPRSPFDAPQIFSRWLPAGMAGGRLPRMRRMHLPHRPAQPRRWLSRDRPTSTRWVTTYSPVSSIIISWSGA